MVFRFCSRSDLFHADHAEWIWSMVVSHEEAEEEDERRMTRRGDGGEYEQQERNGPHNSMLHVLQQDFRILEANVSRALF